MVKYDPQVIVTFADSLYRHAASVVLTYTVVGALIGLASGGAVGIAVLDGGGRIGAAVGALLLGAIAFKLGQQKAFALRLQAQIALCQVQIEANTGGQKEAVS